MDKNKYCYWGPHPWEMDGGAVVNYYLLKEQTKLRPRDEYYGIPKVPEELEAGSLPTVNYLINCKKSEDIVDVMNHFSIPLLNIFHVSHEDFEKIIDPVHDIGGKIVLHQTIHWPDDMILKSNRLNDIDMIVAPTNFAKNIFNIVKKVPKEKIAVIPHAVDITKFRKRPTILKQKLGIPADHKVILYSGRLSFWKGVQELIPIIRPLTKDYKCTFIIRGGYFGGDKHGEALFKVFDNMAKRNPNLIFIPDWQSPEFMEELYSMVDILAFNSAHEGFGVPLIEAQAVEAVPVTTAIANHVEILGATGERGILLDPRVKVGEVNDGTILKVASSDQLFGAIKVLLEEPNLIKFMGRRGRANVEQKYNLTTIAQHWLSLYDDLLPENFSMDDEAKRRLLELT